MSQPTMTGDKNGIDLWSRMNSTKDESEAAYTRGVAGAAQQYGKVWFSDCVAQRNTGANQPIYQMTWDANNYNWEITLFLNPDPTPVSPPKEIEVSVDDLEWEEVHVDDVIMI